MDALVPIITEAVILAVKKDLFEYMLETKCCIWSKRKIHYVWKKVDSLEVKAETIREAVEFIKKALEDGEIDKEEKSIILDFATKISLV